MTAAQRPRLATADDLATLGDDRVEVIAGVLVEKAAPSFEHGNAQSSIIEALKGPYQRGRGGPGGWWIATEVEVELSKHDVYLPDVAGWRRERVPELPKGRPVRVRPDWVCEILSASNAPNDLGVKFAAYHRAGVAHYWVVDTDRERLTVFRAEPEGYVIALEASRADVINAEPFPEITLRVAEPFG